MLRFLRLKCALTGSASPVSDTLTGVTISCAPVCSSDLPVDEFEDYSFTTKQSTHLTSILSDSDQLSDHLDLTETIHTPTLTKMFSVNIYVSGICVHLL